MPAGAPPLPRYCPYCAAPLADCVIDGCKRRRCAADGCGFVHWDNPVPVVAALVELDGAVLLARNHAWPPRQFGLITGFLERDEAPAAAAAREVAEELGLVAMATTWIGNYAFAPQNQVLLAYHVCASGTPTLNEEIAEVRRVDPARLKPWDFGTGLAVRDWLARRAREDRDSTQAGASSPM